MKEDVLEQIVDDYLQYRGYFTTHSVRFRPRPDHADYVKADDSVRSDVDVVGFNPLRRGHERVWVVTCKSWQAGFNATSKLGQLKGELKGRKRPTWKYFRELWSPKWAEAFTTRIKELTCQDKFRYLIAVTRLTGDPDLWSNDETIQRNLKGNPVGFITLEEMWAGVLADASRTPAPSEIGRLAQLLKAAGVAGRG